LEFTFLNCETKVTCSPSSSQYPIRETQDCDGVALAILFP